MTDSQTPAARISRALELETRAVEADRRWPEAPSIARNLRWAARRQRRAVARECGLAA